MGYTAKLGFLILLGLLTVPTAPAQSQECDVNDPTLLKPDLIALPPANPYVYARSGHRLLVFTTSIGNVGDGPLILHGAPVTDGAAVTLATQEIRRTDGTSCTHRVGEFEFHPEHQHWHFDDFSDYQLRKDDPFTGEIVRRSTKVSFCLLDVMRLPDFFGSTQFRNTCMSPGGTQGISVGYADVYDMFLPGQNIDLDDPDPLPAGDYFLVNIANPEKLIWEMNDDTEANAGVISVGIDDRGIAGIRGRVQVHQPLSPAVPIHAGDPSAPPKKPVAPKKPKAPKKPLAPPSRTHVIVHQPHAPHRPGLSIVDPPSVDPPSVDQPAVDQPSVDQPSVPVAGKHLPHRPHQPGQ